MLCYRDNTATTTTTTTTTSKTTTTTTTTTTRMVQLPATAAIEYVAAYCRTRTRTRMKTGTKTKIGTITKTVQGPFARSPQVQCVYAPSRLSVPSILAWRTNIQTYIQKRESSAKLTNQRVSYAFTSSPFSFHACHILPASKLQYSYSCILLIFYRHQWTACMRTVSVNTVHWFDASSSGNPNE